MPYHPDELVRSVSLTTILLPVSEGPNFLLPVLLPADSDGGFLRVSEHFLQAHNLKVVGSNPTPATNNITKQADTAVRSDGGFFVG